MAVIIAAPILGALVILQSVVLSRVPLLYGTPDLVLLAVIAWALQKRVQTAWQWGIIGGLFVSYVSALPFGILLFGYLLVVGLVLAMRSRIWQVPILAMFIATFVGTLITHLLALIALRIIGNPISWLEALNMITLPSVIYNMMLALPFFVLLGDLAKWLYPEEIEI